LAAFVTDPVSGNYKRAAGALAVFVVDLLFTIYIRSIGALAVSATNSRLLSYKRTIETPTVDPRSIGRRPSKREPHVLL